MCGIFCSILKNANNEPNCHEFDDLLVELLSNRGPNCQTSSTTKSATFGNVLLRGFVLWQQGDTPIQQPYEHNGCSLLFNGDIFNLQNIKPASMSDTQWLAIKFSECLDDQQICALLSTLEGPYSLILLNSQTRSLYFARDSLGRNSLLVENSDSGLRLMSVAVNRNEARTVMEVPPLGFFKLHLDALDQWTLFPWHDLHRTEYAEELCTLQKTILVDIKLATQINCPWLLQPTKWPKTADYFNLYELLATDGKRQPTEVYKLLLANDAIVRTVHKLGALLENSVDERVQKTTKQCSSCLAENLTNCQHAKVGILFSGGIDCTILALIAHKFIAADDEIELINVAFEAVKPSADHMWNVPDRISARNSYDEIKRLCPQRKWHFIEVNVSREDLHRHLARHIRHLIYPRITILDESIGCAFWFAARAHDHLSTTRVILLGSGADELFGGYVRHRNAYRRCAGSQADKLLNVEAELEMDWKRIPSRNLARDDRVIADSSRTARAPFIEERFVQFVRSLRAEQRSCYVLDEGLGDKLLLRLYGYSLGLREACNLKKRAIQFGSRIADKKQNAQDASSYLKM